jgi:hypothetical protein
MKIDLILKLNMYHKQKFYFYLRYVYDTFLFYGYLKRGGNSHYVVA